MVSRHTKTPVLPQQLKALVRVGAIANHVAQTPYLVGPTPHLYISENRLEGSQVGVDISHDGITHIKEYTSF